MRARALFCAALLAGNAVAQEPPETSLPPEARPEGLAAEKPEPSEAVKREEPEPVEPADNEVAVSDSGPPKFSLITADPEGRAACRADLEALGVVFAEVSALSDPDDTDCGVEHPLRVTALPGGVALEPAGTMRCETALALARWTEEHVRPAAAHLPERGTLSAIAQGSGYICKRRNGRPEGKISEHSFGNAIDIMAFRFAKGPPIPVEPRERDGTMAEAFQDAVRATACLHFTTVLGPGSDAAHADHLHLDVKSRRGGFRLCQ